MTRFNSAFAAQLDQFFAFRTAMGFAVNPYDCILSQFDRFCCANHPNEAALHQDLVMGWLAAEAEAKAEKNNMHGKAVAMRLFGKYLRSVGQDAYCLPEGLFSIKCTFMPYLFADAELRSFFRAADTLNEKNWHGDPYGPLVAPVLFRLLYTCGLRPGEARTLKCNQVQMESGEVLISAIKRHKERIVVMSEDMRKLLGSYLNSRELFGRGSEYLFPLQSGEAYTSKRMRYLFWRCWQLANPHIQLTELPQARPYDLRHRFASVLLNRWLDEKLDLYAMLPYLQAFMGHEKISATVYYIHLLPEHLLKSPGVNWDAINSILPEVDEWPE
jgi:integrase